MSIALVVTRGYGNGTYNGTIKDVTLRGYTFGEGFDDSTLFTDTDILQKPINAILSECDETQKLRDEMKAKGRGNWGKGEIKFLPKLRGRYKGPLK